MGGQRRARHTGTDLLRDKKQDLREVSASFTRLFRGGRSLRVPLRYEFTAGILQEVERTLSHWCVVEREMLVLH